MHVVFVRADAHDRAIVLSGKIVLNDGDIVLATPKGTLCLMYANVILMQNLQKLAIKNLNRCIALSRIDEFREPFVQRSYNGYVMHFLRQKLHHSTTFFTTKFLGTNTETMTGAHLGFLKGRGPNFEMGANIQAARYKLQILYTSKKKNPA